MLSLIHILSICTNFEGALMKAIRSLEQHVDSLMSYDFTGLSYTGLVKELEIVDDMRIWRIAEALRRGFPYGLIHEITRIDIWFIDKLAILVEMEKELKAVGEGKKELTTEPVSYTHLLTAFTYRFYFCFGNFWRIISK